MKTPTTIEELLSILEEGNHIVTLNGVRVDAAPALFAGPPPTPTCWIGSVGHVVKEEHLPGIVIRDKHMTTARFKEELTALVELHGAAHIVIDYPQALCGAVHPPVTIDPEHRGNPDNKPCAKCSRIADKLNLPRN